MKKVIFVIIIIIFFNTNVTADSWNFREALGSTYSKCLVNRLKNVTSDEAVKHIQNSCWVDFGRYEEAAERIVIFNQLVKHPGGIIMDKKGFGLLIQSVKDYELLERLKEAMEHKKLIKP